MVGLVSWWDGWVGFYCWMLCVRTALTDTGVEDFGEDFVSFGQLDGVVMDELDRSAETAYESYGLGLGDLVVSRHLQCRGRIDRLAFGRFAWSKMLHVKKRRNDGTSPTI